MTDPIVVQDVVKEYRSRRGEPVRAVDGMTFRVSPGQIFGLLGPNGAGKTTLIKILTTLTLPHSGRAWLLGHDVVREPLAVRRSIAVVLQENAIELFLTVRDNLVTFGKFHGLSLAEARRRADRVLDQFRLEEYAQQKAQDLSGGYRRRVQVAKMFTVSTPLLFLDEATTGMDPIIKRDFLMLLRQEARNGRTIVLTTQILSEAEELCDTILIMNRGRIVAHGDLPSLKMLAHQMYDVVLTLKEVNASLREFLSQLRLPRLQFKETSIEFTVKGSEHSVLQIVEEATRRANVLRFEVAGASLEDVFLELLKDSP
ncbi:MAG TPA: ABC transporter ATP-binding protein [Candidatus Acidoferrales bacterium]